MHGQITKDLISCIQPDGFLDHKKFSSLHPMSDSLYKDLEKLASKGLISVDRDGMGRIVEFEATKALIDLGKII